MIKNKEYMDYLKKAIACISNGDYYSAKEISVLTLQSLEKTTSVMDKELDKYVKQYKCKEKIKEIDIDTNAYIKDMYIKYISVKIKQNEPISEMVSLEEFMQKII